MTQESQNSIGNAGYTTDLTEQARNANNGLLKTVDEFFFDNTVNEPIDTISELLNNFFMMKENEIKDADGNPKYSYRDYGGNYVPNLVFGALSMIKFFVKLSDYQNSINMINARLS